MSFLDNTQFLTEPKLRRKFFTCTICLVVENERRYSQQQGMMDDDDENTDDTDDEEEVFNSIERFQQSREKEEETVSSKASGSSHHHHHHHQSSSDEKKGVKKLKFVIRPKEETAAAAADATDDEKEEGRGRTVQSTREMFEKFSLKPPPGFSSKATTPESTSTKPFPSSSKKKEKEEEKDEERNEGWLTHGNDAWQERRGHEEESEREEKYVDELTHTAKKKYGKYAFVEETSSPSGILSDLQVAEPLEFDSVKTKERTNKSDDSSNRNNNNNNHKREEEEVDVSESFLLESSMENDPFKSDDEFDDVRKLEIRNANRARSPPNEDQVAHARVLVQSGIVKFNLNDLRGALCDFQNACVLLRDNYHSGDIAFAKAKTHLVAAFLILKCEENKGNVDLCAKLARTLATVTYMADESVFGGFSQQFLLSPKLICRCLRFASAKNFHAKYYLAAKEYLEILLKPFFCADPNTEAALNGMKAQCENAEKQQHGTTRKVDEMESQKRARDIIDELFEEARGG